MVGTTTARWQLGTSGRVWRHGVIGNRYGILELLPVLALGLSCGDAPATEPTAPVSPVATTVVVTPGNVVFTALQETSRLTAEVRDQQGRFMSGVAVTWSSSNTAIANVNATGLVTAVANGTATITATAGPGVEHGNGDCGASSGHGRGRARNRHVADGRHASARRGGIRRERTPGRERGVHLVVERFVRCHGGRYRDWCGASPKVWRRSPPSLAARAATAEITVVPRRKPGPGLDIFDFPMRAIAISGNWGANRDVVQAWEDRGSTGSLIPLEYVAWLRGLHVNSILISVALHYEDSMDSSVSRETGRNRNVPTWRDGSLRQMIREFRGHGFEVYVTLAFEAHEAEAAARPLSRHLLGDPAPPHTGGAPPDEGWRGRITPANWPWRPDHPDHDHFVGEFWRTYADNAVHFARVAQQEGVALYSLGTETDRLFRSRPDPDDEARPESGYMYNDFGDELRDLVSRVRAVYSGRLTYDMHANALIYADYHGSGSGAGHLWEDLDLDIVGISGWFPLTASAPTTVLGVPELQASYETIFQEYLVPLAGRNPGRAIVFTEYGSMDVVEAPADPSSLGARHSEPKTLVFVDRQPKRTG